MGVLSLTPMLNETEKRLFVRWTEQLLVAPNLELGTNFPLASKVSLYLDNIPRVVHRGGWASDSAHIYLAAPAPTSGYPILGAERLGTIAALISLTDTWEPLLEKYSLAVGKTLLDSYNTSMRGLVRAQQQAQGLAFNQAAAQVAAKFEDKWFLPTGSEVQLDSNWTVVN